MADLLVRGVDEMVVKALKERAGAHGRSAEAEHREILAAAKSAGYTITRASVKLNGGVVYRIAGKPGIWTRLEIAHLCGMV